MNSCILHHETTKIVNCLDSLMLIIYSFLGPNVDNIYNSTFIVGFVEKVLTWKSFLTDFFFIY